VEKRKIEGTTTVERLGCTERKTKKFNSSGLAGPKHRDNKKKRKKKQKKKKKKKKPTQNNRKMNEGRRGGCKGRASSLRGFLSKDCGKGENQRNLT